MVDYVSTTSKQLDFVAGNCRDRRFMGVTLIPCASAVRVSLDISGVVWTVGV